MTWTFASAADAGQRIVVEIPPHAVAPADAGAAGLLPRTGGAIAVWFVVLAIGLIVVGAALVLSGRRRAQSPASTAAANASGASTIG